MDYTKYTIALKNSEFVAKLKQANTTERMSDVLKSEDLSANKQEVQALADIIENTNISGGKIGDTTFNNVDSTIDKNVVYQTMLALNGINKRENLFGFSK